MGLITHHTPCTSSRKRQREQEEEEATKTKKEKEWKQQWEVCVGGGRKEGVEGVAGVMGEGEGRG